MKNKKKFYVTTAIDYVNARPHLGHAMEKCIADTIARWHKLSGEEVFFMTGVDENAQKNVEAAKLAGVETKKFIDKNTALFVKLCKLLNADYDKFIRTTAGEHAVVVHEILKKILGNGDIYKDNYEGLYCVGCEEYITEKNLVDGKCPDHNREPVKMSEDAYFFKLSKYEEKLKIFVKNFIVPDARKKEIISRLNEGLKDVCISRKNAEWGIDFLDDKNYKVWVWIDALINYISGAKEMWPADLHIIGKGINWFHSVIWPALLMSGGYELPKKLLVHGYIVNAGKKMSKSLGNVIDPLDLLDTYHSDTVRYSLLRCSVYDDTDYSEEILIQRHNDELANKLGNLVLRVSALAERYGLEKVTNNLLSQLDLKKIGELMDGYELDKALNEIFAFIDVCNEYVQSKKPWETKDKKVLYELVDSIKAITILLWPFLPGTCEKIAKHLEFEIEYDNLNKSLEVKKVSKAPVLFEKIEFEQKNEEIKKQEGVKEIMEGVVNVDYNYWSKLDLRVAVVKKVEDIDGADKLYKMTLDVGELGERVICSGLKEFYSKEELKGRKIVYFSNLEPRKMKGIMSQGMLLAAVNKEHSKVVLLEVDKDAEAGMKIS